MMRLRYLSVALGLIAIAVARDAGAICGRPGDVIFVPHGDRVAPLNAHVRLELPATWRTTALDCSKPSDAPPPSACRPGRFELVLRPALTSRTEGNDVATTKRESVLADAGTVELIPTRLLVAHTRYEVWLQDDSTTHRSRIVAIFTTGDAVDRQAPTWSGITRAFRHHDLGECERDEIAILAPPASDDQTPASQIRYGIWIGRGQGRIDYDAPPLTYAESSPIVQRAGVDRAEVGLSLGSEAVVRPGERFLKIGLRALDLAGNASTPSETTVKL